MSIGVLRLFRPGLVIALMAVFSPSAFANPMDLEVFTDFEPPDTGTLLTIGTSPATATFTGGESTIIGIGHLYHSGGFSWLVEDGATGMIEFETPASVVEFFALDQFDINGGVITAFSPENNVLDTINLTTSFSSPMGDFSNPLSFADLGPISRIEMTNTMGISVIDDFGFSPFVETNPISFQNLNNRFDVDDNTIVNSLDLLKIIRDLNNNGNRALNPGLEGGSTPPPFIDVNGDDIANPLDVVLMLTELNRIAADVNASSAASLAVSVPEPSSFSLTVIALLGLLGLATHKRCKTKSASLN